MEYGEQITMIYIVERVHLFNEMIDGKYFTDDGCVGGEYLKLCCDDIKEIHKTIYKN